MKNYNPTAFEIEKPLRRLPIERQLTRRSFLGWLIRIVVLGALIGLLATLAFRAIAPVISAAPPEEPIVRVDGKEVSLTTLCARYRSDHLMSGDGMDQETANACGF